MHIFLIAIGFFMFYPFVLAETPPAEGFSDDFAGAALSAEWSLQQANPDTYIVDQGELLLLTSGGRTRFDQEKPENLLVLERPLPAGDWRLSANVKLEAKTGYDSFWLGIRRSHRDYIAANVYTYTSGCGVGLFLRIVNLRDRDPEKAPQLSEFKRNLLDDGPFSYRFCSKGGRAYSDQVLTALADRGFTLTLEKRGYHYHAEIAMDLPKGASASQPGGKQRYQSEAVTRFQPVGKAALLLGQWRRAGSGETVGKIDAVVLKPLP